MASVVKRRTKEGEARYDVRWRADATAKKKTFRHLKDADNWKRKIAANELKGLVTDAAVGKETFESYARRWLEARLVKGRPLAPSTRYGYERLLERNLLPYLAKLSLRAIGPEEVRTWHATVAKAAGHDQAAKSYRVLRAILNTAVDDELIYRNPCRIKGAGTEHPSERPMPDTAQVLALIDAMPARYRIVLVLAGLGGLRTGECLGLRRQDIDPLRMAVHIRQQAQEIPGMGRIVKDTKSEAGRRTVVMPREAMRAITDHLEEYGWADSGEIVTSPKGRPARRASVSDAWQTAKQSAGVDEEMVPHDLRHHAATLMARMPGITTKELMARIGHSSPRAALIYQHATEERDQAIATFMSKQLVAAKKSTANAVVSLSRHGRAMEPFERPAARIKRKP
jgi:integrase